MPQDCIPDRWLDYTKVGERVAGTRFVAFKTPLCEAGFNHLLDEYQRFNTDHLVESVPDLGLVIDLTNTSRYYRWKRLADRGVQYRKLRCIGQQVPSEVVVEEFFDIVKRFLENTTSRRALIGVHCTHGVNRTGFMVCSYMIRRMGFRPRDAIVAFEAARGHPIERQEILQALHDTPRGSAPAPRMARARPPSGRDSRRFRNFFAE